jgi:RNA polymerase sigma-70 factor (ECF subfamily)
MQAAQRVAEDAAGGSGAGGAEERMRVLCQVHSESLVRTFLYWTYGDRQVAEDLMQETMLRAWRNLDKLDRDPVSLRPWLMTVARRIAIDMIRARSSRPVQVADNWSEWVVEAPESFGRVHDRSVVRQLLRELSEEQRTVLVHIHIYDRTVPQVARELGIPEGTVKSRLHYALRALRTSLEAEAR